MKCWLKSSREEQDWGQQAAETDNNQVPGTSLAITTSRSSSHVHSPVSPPLQTQTLWGQGSWTWPCGPQENVHLVWGIIWDLFSRRPRLRQHYASLSSGPLCSRGTAQSRRVNTPFYIHLHNPTINTSNWQRHSFKYTSSALNWKWLEDRIFFYVHAICKKIYISCLFFCIQRNIYIYYIFI